MFKRIEQVIDDVGNVVSHAAEVVHNSGGTALVSLAPLSAIVPSAVVLYGATSAIFGTVASLALALGIESTGFAAAKIGVDKSKATGTARWAVGMVSVYVVITMLLLGGLKVAPVAADPGATAGELVTALGQMLLPLLAVLGAIIYAMAADMAAERAAAAAQAAELAQAQADKIAWQREQAEAEAAHQRDLARIKAEANAQAKLAKAGAVTPAVTTAVTNDRATREGDVSRDEKMKRLVTLVTQQPDLGLRDLGNAVGVSHNTASRWLQADGWHKNGNGWERL